MKYLKLFFTTVSLLLVVSCATTQDRWERAVRRNTVAAYKSFLAQYPKGEWAKRARLKIMELEWKSTQSEDTMEGYEAFLMQYPNGELADRARSKIMELEWKSVASKNTLEAYEDFLTQYPYGDLADKARSKMMELEWQAVRSEDTLEGYESFLAKYPAGNHTIPAYLRLKKLYADIDWKTARDVDSSASYTSFLIKHPFTKYCAEAYRRLESMGDTELRAFRTMVSAQVRKLKLKHKHVVSVFAAFWTEDPSFFVVKKPGGLCVKVGHENSVPYIQAARLPLLRFAKPQEGVVLFIQRKALTKDSADKLIARLLFSRHAKNELGISGKQGLIYFPRGNGNDTYQLLSSSLASDTNHMLPREKKPASIRKLKKDLHQAMMSPDLSTRLLAARLWLFLKSREYKSLSFRVDVDFEFYARHRLLDCSFIDPLIMNSIKWSFIRLANFFYTKEENADLSLRVKIRTDALAFLYSGKRTHRLYTGAEVKGTITVEIPGVASIKRTFEGYERPIERLIYYRPSELSDMKNPCQVPYESAFSKSNFKSALKSAVLGILGGTLVYNQKSLEEKIQPER